MNGTGTLTLGGAADNYTGGTTQTAGTLTSTVTGGFGAGSVTVNPTGLTSTAADNATLNTAGSIAITAALTVNSESSDGGFGIGTVNFNGTTPQIGPQRQRLGHIEQRQRHSLDCRQCLQQPLLELFLARSPTAQALAA